MRGSRFASPDNATVDSQGRLWIATDQGEGWPKTGKADGLYAPPDDETLFAAVQHPGTDGTTDFKGFERESSFEDPATGWPDFKPDMPPRSSVLAITKAGGGKIA